MTVKQPAKIGDDAKKVKMEISKLIPELEDKMRKNTLSDFEDVLDKCNIILILFKSLPTGSVISKGEFEKHEHIEGKNKEC